MKRWWEELCSRGRSSRRRVACLQLEELGPRRLPANLVLNGSLGNDTFVITTAEVSGVKHFFNNNVDTGVAADSSSTVSINALPGSDLIDLSALTIADYAGSTL